MMRKVALFCFFLANIVLISACANKAQNYSMPDTGIKQVKSQKKISQVALYSDQRKPNCPYRVIGVASVAKYNDQGKPIQEQFIQNRMKTIAAEMGGDGLMNLSQNGDNTIQGNVIVFQKILI